MVIGLEKLRARCVMTTYDPDTQAQDLTVLRRIVDDFAGRMALDSVVLAEGTIEIGDPVELLGELDLPRTIGFPRRNHAAGPRPSQ